jgi:hypothetical protein
MRFVSSLKPTDVAQRNSGDIQEALEKTFKHVLSVLREVAHKNIAKSLCGGWTMESASQL